MTVGTTQLDLTDWASEDKFLSTDSDSVSLIGVVKDGGTVSVSCRTYEAGVDAFDFKLLATKVTTLHP